MKKEKKSREKIGDKIMSWRILVVEDDEGLLRLIEKRLKKSGYQVEGVLTGEEAIKKLCKNPETLVLLDYQLQDMTGRQVIETLTEEGLSPPFIIMTGRGDEKIAVDMMKLGAQDYLVKDADFLDLMPSKVSQVIEHLDLERMLITAEETLKESETKLLEAQSIAHIGNWSWNLQTDELFWSEENYRIFGLSSKVSPSYEAFEKTIHPDDLEFVNKSVEDVLKRKKPYDIEFRIILPGDKEGVVHALGKVDYDEEDKPVRFFGTVQDITEHKKVEEELKIKDNAIAMSVDAIILANLDGTLNYVNNAFLKMWGYIDEKEVVGKHGSEFFQIEDKVLDVIKSIQDQGGWMGERVAKRKDGTLFYVQVSASVVMDDGGKPVCMMASVVDITERKKAEVVLRESEEKFRSIFENITNIFYRTDLEGNVTLVNPAGVRAVGYNNINEVTGKNLAEEFYYNPKDREKFIKELKKHGEVKNYEIILKRKDGTPLIVETNSYFIYDKAGKPVGVEGIAGDITARKQAEEALLKSEEKYRSFFDYDITGDFTSTPDGQLIDCNPAFLQIFGFASLEETKSVELESLYPTPAEFHKMVARIEREKKIVNYEHEMCKADGETIFVNQKTIGEFDEQDKFIKIRSYIIDITERKKAETALRESEEKFRNLADYSPNMIFINKGGKVVYANKKCEEIMGYTKEEFYSSDFDFLTLIAPESKDSVITNFRNHMKGMEISAYEYTLITKKGKRIESLQNSKLIKYDGENAVLGIVTDITERKKAEGALQALVKATVGTTGQEFFDGIASNLCEWLGTDCAIVGRITDENNVKALSMQLDGKIIHEYSYILDGTPCENVAKKGYCVYPEGICKLFPDDKDLVDLGAEGYVGTPLRDKNNKPIGILCAISRQKLDLPSQAEDVMDIIAAKTSAEIERKHAEKTLKNTKAFLDNIIQSAPDAIITVDLNDKITSFSPSAEAMFGYKAEDIVGEPVLKLYPKRQRKKRKRWMEKLLKEGRLGRIKTKQQNADGKTFDVSLSMALLRDANGKPIGIVGVSHDITKELKAERELKKANQELKELDRM
ncbi:MAG: PAS domain S-box protein, partial [Candidatus Hydrothermarchaeales archaeon]